MRAVYRLDHAILTAGQPEPGHFNTLRDAGCEAVLSLLPPGQEPEWEEGLVDDLGMDYAVVPVVWLDPRPRDFERFQQVLQQWHGRRLLVHCSANLRVSSFFYIRNRIGGTVDPADAKSELEAIWTPNPIWQNFIDRMLPPES